jgi:hypothetical protein
MGKSGIIIKIYNLIFSYEVKDFFLTMTFQILTAVRLSIHVVGGGRGNSRLIDL